MKINKRKIIEYIVFAFAVVIFAITFIDSEYIPSWDDILGAKKHSEETDAVYFLDCGQGDSALIESNGRFALIDTGDGKIDLSKDLKDHGVKKLDAVILTHWDNDHYGGYKDIADKIQILNLVTDSSPNNEKDEKLANEILNLSESNGTENHIAIPGMEIDIGEIKITVVFHDEDAEEDNNRSIVTIAECHGSKFLFTGDAESSAEEKMLNEKIKLECDVLKVGHHGSKYSSSKKFLEKVNPKYAVISCGKDNKYGHPHSESVYRLKNKGVTVFRTDERGEITFDMTNGELSPATEK